jgi:hypothetical protein
LGAYGGGDKGAEELPATDRRWGGCVCHGSSLVVKERICFWMLTPVNAGSGNHAR